MVSTKIYDTGLIVGLNIIFLSALLFIKFAPYLFFKIPVYGHMLYKLTGGVLPPYFVLEPWEEKEYRTWLREGDLVVASGTKAGTTWMLYCTHQIRVKGKEWDWNDISFTTPWPEWIQKPGQTWSEIKELMNTTVIDGKAFKDYWDHQSYPFRIYKSHYLPFNSSDSNYAVLPVRQFPQVKFLAMARDGLDVVSSFQRHRENINEDWAWMWGGYPPKPSGPQDLLEKALPNGPLSFLYFDYVKAWWPFRNDPNVLLLHYSDIKNDLRGGIKKLAEFLDVSLTNEEMNMVEEKCGYNHMKANSEYFQYKAPFSGVDDLSLFSAGKFISKGKSGQGKLTFTNEQKETWEEAEKRVFQDPKLLNWVRQGTS